MDFSGELIGKNMVLYLTYPFDSSHGIGEKYFCGIEKIRNREFPFYYSVVFAEFFNKIFSHGSFDTSFR